MSQSSLSILRPSTSRAATIVVAGLALFTILLLLVKCFQVLLLSFAGLLLGIFLTDLTEWIRRRTNLSYLSSFFFLLAVGLFFFLGSLLLLIPKITELQGFADELTQAAQFLRSEINTLPFIELNERGDGSFLENDTLWNIARQMLFGGWGLLVSLFVIAFIGIYLAASPRDYYESVLTLFPSGQQPQHLLSKLRQTLSSWILGRLISMAIVGILTLGALLFLGVPYSIPLALLAAMFSFIPNVGPIIGIAPAVLLALQQSQSSALAVLLAYGVIQFIESYLVTPLVQEHHVHLKPVTVLVAQLTFTTLGGALGLALATPLTAVGKVLFQRWHVKRVRPKAEERTPGKALRESNSKAASN